ncbi:ATP-binding protein [Bacillus thuringiensis]
MQTLYFDSSSNLKDLIGRRLVTNKISAIFELVKNSFDADALEVVVEFDEENNQLTISDNGDGMTYEDIKNKWMVIGTDNKKGRIYTKSGRPLNGEKVKEANFIDGYNEYYKYFMLAYLYRLIDLNELSEKSFQQAKALNPNYMPLRYLEKFTGELESEVS